MAIAAAGRSIGTGLLARDGQVRVLVAGAHRSGTTWLGNILSQHHDTRVITEPFNKNSGIEGIRHWYVFSTGADTPYSALIDALFTTRRIRFRPRIAGEPLRRTVRRVLWPGPWDRIYTEALRRPAAHLLIKDPHASMMAEHLIVRFGFKAVFAVKHPFSFYDSLLRVGWHARLPIPDFLDQSPAAFADDPDLLKQSFATQAAAVWRVVNGRALDLVRRYPDNARIVRHEDLCLAPDRTLVDLTGFLGLEYGPAMRHYVAATMAGQSVRPGQDVVFDFKRNSSALPRRWTSTLTPEDCADLRSGTRRVCDALYPDDASFDDPTDRVSRVLGVSPSPR